jgi:hypothetical protein
MPKAIYKTDFSRIVLPTLHPDRLAAMPLRDVSEPHGPQGELETMHEATVLLLLDTCKSFRATNILTSATLLLLLRLVLRFVEWLLTAA